MNRIKSKLAICLTVLLVAAVMSAGIAAFAAEPDAYFDVDAPESVVAGDVFDVTVSCKGSVGASGFTSGSLKIKYDADLLKVESITTAESIYEGIYADNNDGSVNLDDGEALIVLVAVDSFADTDMVCASVTFKAVADGETEITADVDDGEFGEWCADSMPEVGSSTVEIEPFEEPTSEEPSSEEPSSEEPSSEEPSSEEPSSEEPSSEEPSSEEPSSKEPSSDEPSSDEPSSKEPESNEPSSKEPESNEPASKEPSSKEPASKEPTSNEPLKTGLVGDVNGDGKVTAADARIILRYSAQIDVIDARYFHLAETNGKDGITANDAREALRMAAQLEPLRQYQDPAAKV